MFLISTNYHIRPIFIAFLKKVTFPTTFKTSFSKVLIFVSFISFCNIWGIIWQGVWQWKTMFLTQITFSLRFITHCVVSLSELMSCLFLILDNKWRFDVKTDWLVRLRNVAHSQFHKKSKFVNTLLFVSTKTGSFQSYVILLTTTHTHYLGYAKKVWF